MSHCIVVETKNHGPMRIQGSPTLTVDEKTVEALDELITAVVHMFEENPQAKQFNTINF